MINLFEFTFQEPGVTMEKRSWIIIASCSFQFHLLNITSSLHSLFVEEAGALSTVVENRVDKSSSNWFITVTENHVLVFFLYLTAMYILSNCSESGALEKLLKLVYFSKHIKMT